MVGLDGMGDPIAKFHSPPLNCNPWSCRGSLVHAGPSPLSRALGLGCGCDTLGKQALTPVKEKIILTLVKRVRKTLFKNIAIRGERLCSTPSSTRKRGIYSQGAVRGQRMESYQETSRAGDLANYRPRRLATSCEGGMRRLSR